MLGTEELEHGMRAGHAREVVVIGVIAVTMLAVVNSASLVRWTQALPSSPYTAWIAERAADWNALMVRLGPAEWYEHWRRRD